MRFRCRSPRNRKSARLARISARPQHSVYPAVSQNDNHRHSEHEGHRVQRRVATRRATPCVGVIPRKMARYPVHRSTAIHYRRPRLEYRVTRRRGRRRPVTAGPPARLMHKKPPAPKPRAIRTILFGGLSAGHHLPGPGNEGVGEHVRTRFHVGALGPGEIADQRSAPNEENLFLLPDRFSERANSSKGRSSRLT
jgi:hypothetical protein